MNLWSHRFSKNINKKLSGFLPHYFFTTVGQKSWQFFVHILGEMMTSKIHSEIYWPLIGRFLQVFVAFLVNLIFTKLNAWNLLWLSLENVFFLMLLGVCDLRLDLEIFDLRGPTAADNAGTTDDCPDSMVVTVSLIACKSDPAELPKSWFSVNNIIKKSRLVLPF